ncbi:MAG: glycosyl transferase [Marinilabiliales bacterium]|nr:MAG: glycosyl transferase [Marinilabiliales bacterium]
MNEENHIEPAKFLIVRFSSIGDIVLTSPVIRCLKQQVKNAEVHFLTKEQYKPLVESNPYVDKVHCLKEDFKEMIKSLRNEHFDYIIDLHKNLRSHRLKNKLGMMAFSFDKLNWKKWLLTNFKTNKLPDIHIVDRYLESVKLFDVKNDNQGLDFFIPDNISDPIVSIPENISTMYISIVVGAKYKTKQLPPEMVAELCNKLKLPIVLLGGKEDIDAGKYVSENSTNNIFNACGKFSLYESALLLKHSTCVISNDTGLMHISAALKKNIISIWGNTIPEFGMYPYLAGEKSKLFEVKDLSCRPCSKIGFRKCPKKHFNCMMMQDIEAIANYTNKISIV